jgi:NarL family two-component system sensor histidine kinase YdfH
MGQTRLLEKISANLASKPPDDYYLAMRQVRPFYWFLVGGLVIQYGFTVYFFSDTWGATRLIAFTGLMILHGILHWLSPHITYKTLFASPYVLVQSGLALTLVLCADSVGLSYGLFAPLLGEILGMFRRSKRAIIYGIFFLAVSFLSYLLVTDLTQAWVWLVTAVPIAIFVWLYVFSYTNQVQALEQAQKLLAELETAHGQLAEYADQVEGLTRQAERQRMARELHDTLAQGLAGLILQLEAADSHLEGGDSQKAQGIIRQAMGRARATLADARRAIDDLRETPSTPGDLVEAIQGEVEHFRHTTGINCMLTLCDSDCLEVQLAENVLRAISEGLMNIARHAQASQTAVDLVCADQTLQVEIRDNGVGFDPVKAVGQSGHYGLLGIRERARILGGSLTIESAPSQGTTLKLQLPLRDERDNSSTGC